MKIRASLLSVVLCVGLLGAVAPAAQAQTWRHTDAARDALVEPYDGPVPGVAVDPRRGDLTKVSARYDAEALQVASSMDDFCGNSWELRILTSRGDRFVLARSTSAGEGCFSSRVQASRNGSQLTCADVTVQRTKSGIVARVPRVCLGSPYRVRIGLQLSTNMDVERGYGTRDDVYRTGKVTPRQPRLSPWIVGS